MLDIRVTIEGDKVFLNNLQSLGTRLPGAVRRGLEKSAKGVFDEALKNLGGGGAKASNIPPGGYPVPIRTGHLRRSLNWLKPGKTKTHAVTTNIKKGKKKKGSKTSTGTYTAGEFEVIIFDVAEYSRSIQEGTGGNRKYGRRPFLNDAFEEFNRRGMITKNIEREVKSESERLKA